MPILALHGVAKSYGALKVTDRVSLAVEAGETLGILGPNGAGKTTLFNLICGDVQVDAGRVEFEGARHHRVAAAPALPARPGSHLPDPAAVRPDDGVREPGGGGMLRWRAARARRLAHRRARCWSTPGCVGNANRHAGGLTLLNRKRLELARALATKPKLLLLDEIAGGLTEHEATRAGRRTRAASRPPA